ncbi:YaaW family protein [Shewanella sp. Shew256]|uniref:YaaW family protein n=1 Tax=Shewanella sp. Shew256 TaxID=1969376 RepID=UPI000B4A014D|nr:YaaW family protein [Shewanella sp. Shew256]
MKTLINKCTKDDFNYLSKVLDSYLSFTNDKRRKELLVVSDTHPESRKELVELIDKQIKYYASSDLAYLKRALFSDDGGIEAQEIIDDVCSKLKVSIKLGGSIESKLERLVNAVVNKELLDKTPEELSEAFKNLGIDEISRKDILERVKSQGKVLILPIIVEVLGPQVALAIAETIVISLIAQIVGREAAKQLVKELLKRNPFLNVLGPVLWILSGIWLTYDLQGPAYRKTVPICLYLGMVALRDGEEDKKASH